MESNKETNVVTKQAFEKYVTCEMPLFLENFSTQYVLLSAKNTPNLTDFSCFSCHKVVANIGTSTQEEENAA